MKYQKRENTETISAVSKTWNILRIQIVIFAKIKEYSANSMSETAKQKQDTKESSQSTNAMTVQIVLLKETVSKETTARYHLKKETKFFRFQKSL